MRRWNAIWALAGALAVAATGVGCGADGSSQVTASADVEKPTFVNKADAICKQANVRTEDGWEDFVKGKGGDPVKAFEGEEAGNEFATTVILPEKQRQVDELTELTVPEADQKEVEAILAAYQEGIDVGEEDPATVMSSQGVFKYAAKKAEDYGLEDCRW